MLSLIWFQALALAFGLTGLRAQENSAQVPQYEVIMYEGFPLESYPEEARKELKPEKRLLSIRVEAGVQFHAEGTGTMFEGRILGVKAGGVELRIDRSHWGSSACIPISATLELNEAVSPGTCSFSGVIYLYYFRVKRAAKDEGETLEMEGTPKIGMHPTPHHGVTHAVARGRDEN